MSLSYNPSKNYSSIIAGFAITAFLLLFCVLITSYTGWTASLHFSVSALFFISRIAFWVSLGLIYLYVIKKERQPLLVWEEKPYGVWFYLASIGIILLCTFAGSAIIGLALRYTGISRSSKAVQNMLNFGIALKLFIIITAAVVEEFIFRGYLLPRLQLFFKSKYWPIIISAIIFGLAHMRYGTINNVLGPVLIGFIFAWYYQKYRNIKILIICHFLIDFTALILANK